MVYDVYTPYQRYLIIHFLPKIYSPSRQTPQKKRSPPSDKVDTSSKEPSQRGPGFSTKPNESPIRQVANPLRS